MTRNRLSVALYLVLVFLSGVVVGGLGHSYFDKRSAAPPRRPSPEEFRRRFMEDMRQRLKLSDEQVRQIEAILDETRERWRAQMQAIQQEQTSRINALLDERQRAEYEKMRRELEERRKRGHRPPPGR